MLELQKYKAFLVMVALVLLMNACGGSSQNQSEIATAVAQTVQAQNALTEVAGIPTLTSVPSTPSVDITMTPGADIILPTATFTLAPNPGCTLSANLIQEDPPDGTLLKPGESFLKTWWLQNTGTCTWDSTYKLVYWDGDLIGAAVSYPLPVVVAPGETKEIPILLQAPAADDSYRGYWRLKSPWGYDFGVGPSSQSFYVDIIVSNDVNVGYGVTSVSYDYVRHPFGGCPSNPIVYEFFAKITTNGPVKVRYYWIYSDGGQSETETLIFEDASSKTVSNTWNLRGDAPSTPRSVSIVVTAPQQREWGGITYTHTCQ
jgi:hypothetical protein